MRETIGDWKREWIETNGNTNDVEVLISDSQAGDTSYIYEGNFSGIPVELEKRRVVEQWKIIDSSILERIGAYSLMV